MRAALLLAAFTLTAPLAIKAQWTIQTPATTTDLRGIDNVGKGIAWASGTNGTVLRTEDAGYLWQVCTVPPGAEHLDFRGIQAFDANTAIVMSSGPGDQSRLYKTTDGCQTWKLLFTNPDKDGFWDALRMSWPIKGFSSESGGIIIGDPVVGHFAIFRSVDGGSSWKRWGGKQSAFGAEYNEKQAKAQKEESLFAASNESLALWTVDSFLFVTGGPTGARLIYADEGRFCAELGSGCSISFASESLSGLAKGSAAGAFAVASKGPSGYFPLRLMVVGGDYTKPNQTTGTSAFLSSRDGAHAPFTSYFDVITPSTPPHGYRSAVAYDAPTKTWITVGPNGTDISTDDGRNWRPLHPTGNEATDADQHWNALSLPYAVGPHGRIGLLNPDALKPTSTKIPQYEVVSIRPATDHIEFRGADDATDGTHIIHTLKGLVSYAYGVRPEFVSCAIKWCDSVIFDLRAKVADSDIADLQTLTSEQRGLMLKPALAERFGLKLHSETRPLRVYDLVIAKGGTKLHLHPPNATPQTAFANGRPADGVMMFRGSEIKGYAVTISALAKTLSGLFSESVERPVIDKTGLQGTYDFDLKWTPEQTASQSPDAASNGSQQEAPQEDSAPSIFTALQEQLGLKLQAATAPTLMIVVDAAHMPSQN